MGRSPCCSKEGLNRGAWTALEDKILRDYIKVHGEGRWRNLPKKAGLNRCGKSCRLRWLNYLRPDIKRGNISPDEEELIIRLHKLLGNRWSLIAGRLPGRTDNEIKNYWNTNLGKKLHSNHSNAKYKKPATEPSADKAALAVRTKAMRCTEVPFNPQPHKVQNLETKPQAAGPSMVRDFSIDKPVDSGSNSFDGLSSVTPRDGNLSTDFMMDFNTDDLSLSDLLNSNFSLDMCDFNYSNDNANDLSPSSDHHPQILFSQEMLEDWTVSNCNVQPKATSDLQSYGSLQNNGGDWLGE